MEDMKSYLYCFNAGKINTDLLNLLNSKLCLSSNNDHINNFKEYGDFEKQTICLF